MSMQGLELTPHDAPVGKNLEIVFIFLEKVKLNITSNPDKKEMYASMV